MATSATASNQRRRHRRAGFTLIELAVVAGCVVFVGALLQPSLSTARARSKQSVCLERLRNIGTASRTYAADSAQGWAIPTHHLQFEQTSGNITFIGAYEWGGKSGVGQDDYVTGSPGNPLNSKYGTRADFGPNTRPLNTILYPHGFRDNLNPWFDPQGALADTQLDLAAYRCPADDGPPQGGHCESWLLQSEQSSYDHFGTSYAANLFMIANSAGGYMSSNSPYMRPITRIPNPLRTILYEENIGRWAWAAREDWCDFLQGIDVGPTKAIRGWHGKDWVYNRVFGDAHAETQQVYIDGTQDSEGYALHYRTEQVFADPNEQSYNRCIIIRDDGWQKDCMPANPIPTGLYYGGGGRVSYEGCVDD